MKRFLTILIAVVIAVFVSLIVFVFAASAPVPEGTEEIIESVLSAPLPEQILGDTGTARSKDIEIWYESIRPSGSAKGTILLIMGLGGNALEWPLFFINPLVKSGYHVVRFDNRSTGFSTWTEEGFTLDEMAEDALSVMNELKIEKAHILGMSMGGMIGQIMAIEHPERVQTLTSFMSSGYTDDPELPSISRSSYISLVTTGIRYGIRNTERNIVRTTVSVRGILSPYLSPLRIRTLAEQSLYNQRFRKGFNSDAFIQHTKAVSKSGSRYEGLRNLKVPTLIIHGIQDPLIPMEHAKKMAEIVPDARSLLLEGMGHDTSPEHVEQIHRAIIELIEQN